MQSNINKLTKKIEDLIVFSKELRRTNSDLMKKLAASEDEKKQLQEKSHFVILDPSRVKMAILAPKRGPRTQMVRAHGADLRDFIVVSGPSKKTCFFFQK